MRQISAFAEGLGQAYDHVLVLGIGGSALGTRALLLRAPAAGLERAGRRGAREFFPRLTLLDNVDPTSVARAAPPHRPAARRWST